MEIIGDIVKEEIVDTLIEKIELSKEKNFQKFKQKIQKKYPGKHVIWLKLELKKGLLAEAKGSLIFYDELWNEIYKGNITAHKDKVEGIISNLNGEEIWKIEEGTVKPRVLSKNKVIKAGDLNVFQYGKNVGTIRTLKDKEARLFFDFLDWTVVDKKKNYQTISLSGEAVCEHFYTYYDGDIYCIVANYSNIDDILTLINTAIIVNLLARDREKNMQRVVDDKIYEKQLRKGLRKAGGDW